MSTAPDIHCVPFIDACDCSTWTLIQTIVITTVVVFVYTFSKSALERHRLASCQATVVVIGAGPVGLVSALVAARSGRASRVIVFEECDRSTLIARSRQITIGERAVRFLRSQSVGVDVMCSAGATWQQHQCNVTLRVGALLQHLLDTVEMLSAESISNKIGSSKEIHDGGYTEKCNSMKHATSPAQSRAGIELRLATKFTRECLEELENISERIIAVVCDGARGRSSSLLGMSDECSKRSCRAYGATATINRPHTPSPHSSIISPVSATAQMPSASTASAATLSQSVPMEIRVHNITIDMQTAAYNTTIVPSTPQKTIDPCPCTCNSAAATSRMFRSTSSDGHEDPFPTRFHLKIFGELENRCIALAVPRCESSVVRALKVVSDYSIMRGIFRSVFNRYKSPMEDTLNETSAAKYLQFNPRLFEIKLSHRLESVAYIDDANIFIVVEGESARRINFNAGFDFDMAFAGLESLQQFIERAACADNEQKILHTLLEQFKHDQSVSEEFIRNGLKSAIFT